MTLQQYFPTYLCSRVGNEVDLGHSILVFFVLFLVEGLEVLREGLRNDRLHMRLARLGTPRQFEGLKYLLVGRLELELLWLVVRDLQLGGRLAEGLYELLVALELFHLLLSEVSLVGGIALEWKRVIGVLGVSFVVNVALTVLPIRELSSVVALLQHWRVISGYGPKIALLGHYLKRLEGGSVGRVEVHGVRVNYARLFL